MNKAYKIIIFNFIIMTAFNMAHPVTPKLINELNLQPYMFGVLFAVMSIANYIMSPIWGGLSDFRGRKSFLITGVFGYGLAQLGFGLSNTETMILIFRALGGCFAVCYLTTSISYLTDLCDDKTRVKYISYYAAAAALGSSAGSILGGMVGENNYKYSFIAQFIFCIFISMLIQVAIKESLIKKDAKVKISLNHLKFNRSFLGNDSTLNSMLLVVMFLTISTTAYNSTISYYVESVLKLPTSVNGIIMSVAGLIGLTMNIFINPMIDKKFNDKKSIVIIAFIGGISILFVSVFENLMLSALSLSVFIMASALSIPIYQSMIAKLANNNYGQVMGIQGSYKALGMILGSLISGMMFGIGEKLPFLFGSISNFLAFIILVKLYTKSKNNFK